MSSPYKFWCWRPSRGETKETFAMVVAMSASSAATSFVAARDAWDIDLTVSEEVHVADDLGVESVFTVEGRLDPSYYAKTKR